jgi:hypothetical protein
MDRNHFQLLSFFADLKRCGPKNWTSLICQKLCRPFVREYLWVKAKRVEHLRNKWERGGAEDLDQQRAFQVCPGILQYYHLQSSGICENSRPSPA